jgi:hypothetical protein
VTFYSPPLPPPASTWSVAFDGVSHALALPAVAGIRAVSLWVWLDATQPTAGIVYLLDARSGLVDGQVTRACPEQAPSLNNLKTLWPTSPAPATQPTANGKVANRTVKVWHGASENGC